MPHSAWIAARTAPWIAAFRLTLTVGVLTLLLPATGHAAELSPRVADYGGHATGHFTSLAQHRANADYDEVEAHVVRIWPGRADGLWLYQEQAILNQPGVSRDEARTRPYFQRISRISERPDGQLRRDNHVITDAKRFIGLGRDGYRGPQPAPADLAPPGCHNVLELVSPGYWIGRTEDCANSHRGAVRMESRSILARDRFVNWDRGLDAKGGHVWGPRNGGYVFIRIP